jgi:hypothetical protein
MNHKTIKKSLICILTDKERREYGISLATTLGDMEKVEAEKKAEMENYKNRLAGMQAKVDDLSSKVRNGKEWRDVDCHVMYGTPDRQHKQTIRLDTGETVSTDIMSEADLQLIIPLEDDGPGVSPIFDAIEDADDDLMIHDSAEDEEDVAADNDFGGMRRADATKCIQAMAKEKKKANRELLLDKMVEDYGDAGAIELARLATTLSDIPKDVREMILERAREADPSGQHGDY